MYQLVESLSPVAVKVVDRVAIEPSLYETNNIMTKNGYLRWSRWLTWQREPYSCNLLRHISNGTERFPTQALKGGRVETTKRGPRHGKQTHKHITVVFISFKLWFGPPERATSRLVRRGC